MSPNFDPGRSPLAVGVDMDSNIDPAGSPLAVGVDSGPNIDSRRSPIDPNGRNAHDSPSDVPPGPTFVTYQTVSVRWFRT